MTPSTAGERLVAVIYGAFCLLAGLLAFMGLYQVGQPQPAVIAGIYTDHGLPAPSWFIMAAIIFGFGRALKFIATGR